MANDEKDPRTAWRIEVGKRLMLELERARISQTDLARRIGYTKQLISHWGTARSEITLWQLYCLDRLGLDTHFILTGKRAWPPGGALQDHLSATELMGIAQKLNETALKIIKGSG